MHVGDEIRETKIVGTLKKKRDILKFFKTGCEGAD
jgi:hypothetical protein